MRMMTTGVKLWYPNLALLEIKEKVMRYTVIRRSMLSGLTKEVEDYMSRGWECQGGISCAEDGCYLQAMVKGEN